MTEETKKKAEPEHIANIDALDRVKAEYPNCEILIGSVNDPTATKDSPRVFEHYSPICITEEDANKRWGADGGGIAGLIADGTRQRSYRPNYRLVILNDDKTLKSNASDEIDTMLQAYQPGRVSTGGSGVKAKAKVADSISEALAKRSAELGKSISMADLMDRIAKLK